MDGQRIKWRRNIAENLYHLSRAQCTNVTDRQTDDRQTGKTDGWRHIANVSSRSLKT